MAVLVEHRLLSSCGMDNMGRIANSRYHVPNAGATKIRLAFLSDSRDRHTAPC